MKVGENGYIKKPTTFKEQVQILKSRNLIIDDEEKAIRILQRVNYYRLSAYMLSYKTNDELYEGASIDDVYSLYTFDKKLRNLILPLLEDVEISFRTHISYLLAHKYGALGYTDDRNFRNKDYHKSMLEILKQEIDRSDEIFVGHHKHKYKGEFPIWVIIEVATFGDLSKMYSNLLDEDKEEIAQKYYHTKSVFVRSWLHTLSNLRNKCAHYGRLYNKKLTTNPKLYKADMKKGIKNDRIFAGIYIMGRLSNDKDEWEHFVTKLAALIEQYDAVDLKYLGFPEDWEDLLRKMRY